MTWTLPKTLLQLRCSTPECDHVLVTTFDDCPEEEELPCPTGCGGVVRTRPTPPAPKKKARKKRATKKAEPDGQAP